MAISIFDDLGVRYPIILGGLSRVGTAPLAAAVSEAGGLGLLGAGAWDGEILRQQILKTRELTKAAFGVNIPIHAPHVCELVDTALQEGIRVVSTSAGNPRLLTPRLKAGGIFVMHVVPTVSTALKAEEAGVDAVIAEGSESGGRTGTHEISTMVLVPQVVDAVACPVIAAGGIGDGRGLAAAMALGAMGVQMGTVFLAATECEVSHAFKEMLIAAGEADTVLLRDGRSAARLIKQEFQQVFLKDRPDLVEAFMADERAAIRGTGQVVGIIQRVAPAKTLIEQMVSQAREIIPGRV